MGDCLASRLGLSFVTMAVTNLYILSMFLHEFLQCNIKGNRQGYIEWPPQKAKKNASQTVFLVDLPDLEGVVSIKFIRCGPADLEYV